MVPKRPATERVLPAGQQFGAVLVAIIGGFQAKLMTALANISSPAQIQLPVDCRRQRNTLSVWHSCRDRSSVGADMSHEGLRPGTGVARTPIQGHRLADRASSTWNGEVGVAYESITVVQQRQSRHAIRRMDLRVGVNGRLNSGRCLVGELLETTPRAAARRTTVIGSAACGVQAKMYALGYDYVLSKRTKM